MKLRIRNIIILGLACILFFVGAGVTIMQICCSSCFDNIVSARLCSSEKKAPKKSHSCCTDALPRIEEACSQQKHHLPQDKGNCCKMERISVDLEHIPTKTDLARILPFASVYSRYELPCFDCLRNYQCPGVIKPSDPVPLLPRNYLSLISVLII